MVFGFQYYISLLTIKHLILFSFCSSKDYNSRIIKIFLFFFFFASHLTLNALFYNDDNMHQIYVDKGSFNFIYQIPKIIYSSLLSSIISTLIKYLSLSHDNVIDIKQKITKEKHKKNSEIDKLLFKIKRKFIIFFIVAIIILFAFWYYIICFCGIYVNTQIHLIKDSVISLITSLIYPFIINLIPSIFRISALRMEKQSGKYLYRFSSFLENNLA